MRTWVSVPYPCPDGFPTIPARERIGPIARSFRDLLAPMKSDGIDLNAAAETRPLSASDIPAILITHNDMRLIRAFLKHYRDLGITRFLIIDDQSSDGTAEFLTAQPDVDLHSSNRRYKDAYRGRLWRRMLVDKYGRNRWYLYVDPDEFLVFPGQEAGLARLISGLEAAGIYHMPAPMLDMYPPGNVADAVYDGADGRMPWEVASMYDATGYTLTGDERSWKITGGVRKRVFGVDAQLIKYPLVYWGAFTSLNKNIHSPGPYWRNFTPPLGMLLHFKFFSDFREEFQAVVDEGQHFDGSRVYRQMMDAALQPTLQYQSSAAYAGPANLAEQGFLVRLNS